MGSSPKKAAPKKAAKKATPKAAPSSSSRAPAKGSKTKRAAAVDGAELARVRRIVRAGFAAPGRCALLGILLDVGPRADRWRRPRRFEGDVVSELGAAILEAGVSPLSLERAAKRLADGAAR